MAKVAPILQPWMITILQRLVLTERSALTISKDMKTQINALKRRSGVEQAKIFEQRVINAAEIDSKNEFTEIGKIQSILRRLDEIAEYQVNELNPQS